MPNQGLSARLRPDYSIIILKTYKQYQYFHDFFTKLKISFKFHKQINEIFDKN